VTDNPYRPPEADIGDGRPARLLSTRPRQIVQAIGLLWISASLGLSAAFSEAAPDRATLVVSVLVMLALTVVLSVAIWRGRHWGRVLYLVLVVASLAQFLSSWGIVERLPVSMALEAVSFVADAGSFFLLFTKPGSSWFQHVRGRGAVQG
jgi:hypothetical protein